jgi:hypothetical protein
MQVKPISQFFVKLCCDSRLPTYVLLCANELLLGKVLFDAEYGSRGIFEFCPFGKTKSFDLHQKLRPKKSSLNPNFKFSV